MIGHGNRSQELLASTWFRVNICPSHGSSLESWVVKNSQKHPRWSFVAMNCTSCTKFLSSYERPPPSSSNPASITTNVRTFRTDRLLRLIWSMRRLGVVASPVRRLCMNLSSSLGGRLSSRIVSPDGRTVPNDAGRTLSAKGERSNSHRGLASCTSPERDRAVSSNLDRHRPPRYGETSPVSMTTFVWAYVFSMSASCCSRRGGKVGILLVEPLSCVKPTIASFSTLEFVSEYRGVVCFVNKWGIW